MTKPSVQKKILSAKKSWRRVKPEHQTKGFSHKASNAGHGHQPTSLSRLEGQYRLAQDHEVVILAKALDMAVEELPKQDKA